MRLFSLIALLLAFSAYADKSWDFSSTDKSGALTKANTDPNSAIFKAQGQSSSGSVSSIEEIDYAT